MTDAAGRVAELSDDLLALTVRWDPFLCSAVSIPEAAARVPDYSEDGQSCLRSGFARIGAELDGLDAAELGLQDQLTLQMASWQSRVWLSILDSGREEYTVSPYKAWSLPTAITSIMPKTAITSPGEGEAFLERCAALPRALDDTAAALRRGAVAGRTPVRRLVSSVVDLLDQLFAAGGPGPLLASVLTPDGSDGQCARMASVESIARAGVRPALERLRGMLVT